MKNFSIKIIDPRERKYYRTFCIGEIQIGDDLQETFEMPLKYWSKQDYERQWKEGIERLKQQNQSCLIVELELTKTAPRAHTWVLYKDGDMVHIQNIILFGTRFINMLKKEPYTLDTCYNFIDPRETVVDNGMKVSEWDIPLKDVLRYKIK